MSNLIFVGSNITEDGDWSHKIKRHLLLGRKAMTNLEFVLKIRDIILPTKVHLVKGVVFQVVMYGWVPLGQKDALNKGKTTHSSVLSWRIPWAEEPDEL